MLIRHDLDEMLLSPNTRLDVELYLTVIRKILLTQFISVDL